ncbi:TPM domain-containing protein [Candidatus Nomurabacteria bacterium]|nr:TPM domain-containing protein [Candidatus Nomurabacteria bacterium]
MKKFIFLVFAFVFFVGATKGLAFDILARPQNFVNDYAGVLSAESKNALESKISNFEKQTTDEIAVVTIPSLDGDTVENVAQDIFTKWGIGKKDKNNGVLILVAISEHKTRIQTGYGVEGDLTDLATSYMQSEIMAPAFRQNDYYSGLSGAVDKIIESLNGGNVVPEGYSSSKKSNTDWSFIFFLMFIVLQWVIAILGRSKSWWGGGVLGAAIGGIIWFLGLFSFTISAVLFAFLIIFGLGLDFIVSRAYQNAKSKGTRVPWWFGGGGPGGGSGGFGGFGGGMSGGGGSSGGW